MADNAQPIDPAAGAAPADQSAVLAPEQPQVPWVLVGGVLLAAWLWEKHFKKEKSLGEDEDDEDEEDDSDDEEASDVGFTDEPIKKGRKRRSTAGMDDVADVDGPITHTYIQPIKLATNGRCKAAVDLLDKLSKADVHVHSPKRMVVRRALRRAASVVTDKCKKQVLDLIDARREWDESIEEDIERVDIQLPSTGRRFVPTREDVMVPGPKGARSFDPRHGLDVPRTRGEGKRHKRKTEEGKELEYRPEGERGWRVLDLHTGTVTSRKIPTGRPRGRPKKLQ